MGEKARHIERSLPWEQSTLSHVLNCAEKKDTPQGAYNSTVPNEYLTKTMGSGLTASMPTSLQKTIRIHEKNDIAKCNNLHTSYLNNYTLILQTFAAN